MKSEGKFAMVKNASANVARGSAAAIVAIILPPFLTRLMSPEAYGAWLLVLQLSAFVGYLDFGIQTAIGRFVAHAGEREDTAYRDRILSTSLVGLIGAGLIGIVGSGVLALSLSHIFHQIPASLLGQVRIALVLVGTSLAVGLPCSVFNGIFIGLQRYEVPAAIVGGSRLVTAIALVIVVRDGGNLIQMAVITAVISLTTYAVQYVLYRKLAPRSCFSRRLVSRGTGRELFHYCLSLSIWNFAMLLVSGLDVSLVSYFEFKKVAYYAVAATLITFLGGFQTAIFHVMIPSAAVLQARGQFIRLGQRMVTATRYGMFILLLTGLPLIFSGRAILSLWVGQRYAAEGVRILQILTVANMIRLSALPYAVSLIGTGQQRLVILTPFLEGVTNFAASMIAGYFLGAIGVAVGTVVGGLVGVCGNFVYNMPRTREIEFRIADYARDGLLRPVVCAVPLIAAATSLRVLDFTSPTGSYPLVAATFMLTAFLFWRFGLISPEREQLRAWRIVHQG